jgi:hypothetical protein
MRYILHTAQCGSSVLTALLGTVNYHTYSEPSWSHSFIRDNSFPPPFIFIDLPEEAIVKLPSGLCCSAPYISDPKVFIYRKFQDHIYRHLIKGEYWPDTNYFFQYETEHSHPGIAHITPKTDIQKLAYFWLNDVLWVLESSNLLLVHADDLFLKTVETMGEICNFFQIDPVERYEVARYDVKQAGLKGSDEPTSKIFVPGDKLVYRDIKNSVVLKPFRDACPKVREVMM